MHRDPNRVKCLLLISSLYFVTDGVPYDGVPEDDIEKVHVSLTITFCLLSTMGIVFALSCMLFNYLYRDRRYFSSMYT